MRLSQASCHKPEQLTVSGLGGGGLLGADLGLSIALLAGVPLGITGCLSDSSSSLLGCCRLPIGLGSGLLLVLLLRVLLLLLLLSLCAGAATTNVCELRGFVNTL